MTTVAALKAALRHALDDGYDLFALGGVGYCWRDLKTGELLPGSYPNQVAALRILCPVTEALVTGLPGATTQDSADLAEDCKTKAYQRRRKGGSA